MDSFDILFQEETISIQPPHKKNLSENTKPFMGEEQYGYKPMENLLTTLLLSSAINPH